MSYSLDPAIARQLRFWLYCVAALIAVMVLVGGATRLTESGLSITEWKPIDGTLPPLSAQHWQDEFQKYRQIPQYTELNRGMSLHEFKTIYWWEWSHRFLGRLIGLAFALPFLFFALTKKLPRPLLVKLGALLVLGGMQGAIGWWMVASGLAERVNVAPYRLAIHLTLALALFAAVLWIAFDLDRKNNSVVKGSAHTALIMLVLIFIQIFLGGLVAGNRAGYVYNTWPLMEGAIIPSGLFIIEPWWRNFFENTALVQFLHRSAAYLILLFAFVSCIRHRTTADLVLLCAVLVQAGLGIATLLSNMTLAIALAHQAGIILVLVLVVSHCRKTHLL